MNRDFGMNMFEISLSCWCNAVARDYSKFQATLIDFDRNVLFLNITLLRSEHVTYFTLIPKCPNTDFI